MAVMIALIGVASSASSAASNNKPIVIATVGDYTGGDAANTLGGLDAIKAWTDSVNAAGGIDGHKVQLIVKDDALSASTASSEVQELVSVDHVVAIVSDLSVLDSVWGPIAAKAGVPVIGGLSLESVFLTNPDFFNEGANNIALTYGMQKLARTEGKDMGVLYCAESPVCAQLVPLQNDIAKYTGITVPTSAAVSATAPSYTAQCLAIKNSGAQTYAAFLASPVVQRVSTACASQGVTTKVVALDGGLAGVPNIAQTPGLNGELNSESVFPWFADSSPATKAFHAALAKYTPSLGDKVDSQSAYAWTSAELFEKAVELSGSGSGPVTSASVKAGLYKMKGQTLGGLTGPLTFVKGQANLQNCYFTFGIKNGKFVLNNGLNTTCAPDADVNAVIKELG